MDVAVRTPMRPTVRRTRDGAPPAGPTGADVDPIRPFGTIAFEGYTVLVCDSGGEISAPRHGLFDMDCRILSRHRIRLDGEAPRPAGGCVAAADRWSATLTRKRDGGTAEGPSLPQDAWGVRIDRRVGCGMTETIRVTNHSMARAPTRLTIELDADFTDVLTPVDAEPEQRLETTWDADSGQLVIGATTTWRDRKDVRAIAIRSSEPPTEVTSSATSGSTARTLVFELELEAGQHHELELVYRSLVDGRWRDPSQAGERIERREAWRRTRTRVMTSERLVGPAFQRAADDLLALRQWELEPAPDGRAWVVNAGVPTFTGFFGRDSITAGWQAALLGPEPLRGALEIAARTQGRESVDWTEEEPGRMVHEMRRGPLSTLEVRPHARYYGSQTTGVMFLLGLSELWHWTGDDDALRRFRDPAMRVIEWADGLGDRDGDGFLEYQTRSNDGLKNQGWKDSDEAIRYPDGRNVPNPIATVEEQAFHFLALQRMAEIAVALDEPADVADGLLRRADRLRDRWHKAFWMPDEGFYAMALDPDHQQVGSIGSNPGHALGVGIIPASVAERVADRLLAPDLFSGWGVRTLSRDHPSYNPFAYHLGAVWPVENATIALGFKRYGFDDHLDQLAEGFFAAVAHCRDLRLPEALTGHDRADTPTPLPYPGSQSPQAWSASAVIQLVQIMLGLYPFAPAKLLGLVRPRLPTWLPEMTLEGMRVGDAIATIRFERDDDGHARHDVLERAGTLHIVEVPPPDAVGGPSGLREHLLSWAMDHAPGRLPTALRIAIGDETGID
jgi:glycogen debranching enzyme